MNVLSAAEAVSPAVKRTRRFLFQPFRLGTFLKMAAVATISEGLTMNLNFSTPSPNLGGSSSGSKMLEGSGWAAMQPPAMWIAWGVLIGVAALALALWIFYLVVRLRFAFFDCLVRQSTEVRPGWRRYGRQAARMFKLNLAVGAAVIVALGVPIALAVMAVVRAQSAGQKIEFGNWIFMIPVFVLVVLVAAVACVAIEVVLHDLMLPHMALEDASIGEAWAAARQRIAAEKGPFFLYLVLRVLLPFIAVIAAFIVAIIPTLIVAGGLAVAAIAVNVMLANAAGAGAVLRIGLDIAIGLVAFAFLLFVNFSLCGPIATWLRNFALLFYGGRYRALGDLLSPPPPAGIEPLPAAGE